MSRTTLTLLTAGGLTLVSLALMAGRYSLLGDEVKLPRGPGTFKVTLLVQGAISGNDARLTTGVPLDMGRQHILREDSRSSEFFPKAVQDSKHPDRRQVAWTPRPGVGDGPFRARYECYCSVDLPQPNASMTRLAHQLYAAPRAGECLAPEPCIESDAVDVSELARLVIQGHDRPKDQLEALYRHVEQEIANEPTVAGPATSALACLRAGSGDSAAKSRLLAALCRNRGIPARLVSGLALGRGHEQGMHVWVEAWVHEHWMPLCAFNRHFGRVPSTYLIFHYGDAPLVRGRNVKDLNHAFLIERVVREEPVVAASPFRNLLLRYSLFALPPAEQHLVEFLLLLPIAALIVCVYRNLIGLNSFGTFAPALLGLAFRDLGSLPGILVFVSIVLVGWLLRRFLDAYHLLQVPRMAFLLSLVVVVLVTAIVAANDNALPVTRYISLFPMVILTGMIERFWTLEAEDGTATSFRTLLNTMLIAATISLVLSLTAIVRHLFRFPESLGMIMAAQLLIGRYKGYRLSELLRFRDFLRSGPALNPGPG